MSTELEYYSEGFEQLTFKDYVEKNNYIVRTWKKACLTETRKRDVMPLHIGEYSAISKEVAERLEIDKLKSLGINPNVVDLDVIEEKIAE